MALGDGKLYIDHLRESHPTTARLAEIALSGALGGGLKSLIMVPARQGLDAAVNEFAGEQIQNATDFVTNHAGRLITKDDETYGEFAELADGGSYQNRQGRVKAGSEFILGTVLGVIGTGKGGESGTAVGVKGNSNSGHTSNNSTGNQPEGATVQDSSGNSVAKGAGKKIPNCELCGPPNKRGNAPIGNDGHPVELHHRNQNPNGSLDEMTRTDHRLGDNFKKNHSNTGQEASKIDRSAWRKEQKDYWKNEWDSGRFDDL